MRFSRYFILAMLMLAALLGPGISSEVHNGILAHPQASARFAVTQSRSQPDSISPVVLIASFIQGHERWSLQKTGSGSIIHSEGIILTNSHVIRTGRGGCGTTVTGDVADKLIILVEEREGERPVPRYVAEFIADDPDLDLALIRVVKQFTVEEIEDLNELARALSEGRYSETDILQPLDLPSLLIWDSDQTHREDTIKVRSYPDIDPDSPIAPILGVAPGSVFGEEPEGFFLLNVFATFGSSGGAVVDVENNYLVGVICGGVNVEVYTGVQRFLARARLINLASSILAQSPQRINRVPVARFVFRPELPRPEEEVEFDATDSRDLDGQIIIYRWQWGFDTNGDGRITGGEVKAEKSGEVVAFTFSKPPADRDPLAALTVTDDEGLSHASIEAIRIQREVQCRVEIVGQEGEYSSIQAAIADAPPGATVQVAPGACQESILIDKPLTLEGAGQDLVTLYGDGRNPVIEIRSQEGPVTVQGFTIQGGLVGIEMISGTEVTIRSNAIQGNSAEGVNILRTDQVTLGNSLIQNNEGWGVSLLRASIDMQTNTIRANRAGGVFIDSSKEVVFSEGNVVEDNSGVGVQVVASEVEIVDAQIKEIEPDAAGDFGNGIAVEEGSVVTIEGSKIGHSVTGLVVGDATATVKGNTAICGNFVGILARDGGQVTFENSHVYRNTYAGLWLLRSAEAIINNSTVSENALAGIQMAGGATISLSSSTISDNGDAGLRLLDSAQASLSNSNIIRNCMNPKTQPLLLKECSGLVLWDSAHVALVGSTVSRNRFAGFRLFSSTDASLNNSTVSSNGDVGLQVFSDAHASLTHSTVSGNGKTGLDVSGEAVLEVQDSWISDNAVCGIYRKHYAKVEGQDNWVLNNHKNLCDFSPPKGFLRPEAPPLLDKAEVCPQGCDFLEVGPAIWAVYPGGVVHIGTGTYPGGLVLVKDLTIEGAGSDQTIVENSAWDGFLIGGSAVVTLVDLGIGENTGNGVAVVSSAKMILSESRVFDNLEGIFVTDSATAEIQQVLIEGNTCHGLWAWRNTQVTLQDSHILGNTDGPCCYDPHCKYGQEAQGAVELLHSASTTIRSNVIQGNHNFGIELAQEAQATVEDNEIQDNARWGVILIQPPCFDWPEPFTGEVKGSGNKITGNGSALSNQEKQNGDGVGDVCPKDLEFLKEEDQT